MDIIVECPLDPGLYAVFGPTASGEISVRICRRAGWRDSAHGLAGRSVVHILGEMMVDAPLHLVADRVHDLLMEMVR